MPCVSEQPVVPYRLAIMPPDSGRIFVHRVDGGPTLPILEIARWTRPAVELQRAVRTRWGLEVVFLDILPPTGSLASCAIAELLSFEPARNLHTVPLFQLPDTELRETERDRLESISLNKASDGPFVRRGWINEAIRWIEAETTCTVSSRGAIEQFNVGPRFSLLHFQMTNGKDYWLKATGEPNVHELSLTRALSQIFGNGLPELISLRTDWNAWIMAGGAKPFTELTDDPLQLALSLEKAGTVMAELQVSTISRRDQLLRAGAFDHDPVILHQNCDAIFDFLDEAMILQTSTKVKPISQSRLIEIRSVVKSVCERLQGLAIPQTVIHGDLNRGNILATNDSCIFIDWCETYVGNPLSCLQHILLLNSIDEDSLRVQTNRRVTRHYKEVWANFCDPHSMDIGIVCMPIVAALSTLYNRGDWLTSEKRDDPHRQSYARTVARHLDRAAREPNLVEVLCN